MTAFPSLPIDAVLSQLLTVLADRGTAVLVAPPGAGKTTRVPLALLEAAWRGDQRIIVLSPRRLAARTAAQRMAHQLNEPVGQTVGYRVRLDNKISAQTRIEVVTEGVFTRQILSEPELKGVGAVLFDEFHERSLEGDLGLALARDAQQGLREDLRLLVMSATLDGARISALLDNAPVIESAGRAFPVTFTYLGRPPQGQRLEQAICTAVSRALRQEDGSILVFLPGQGEIERCATLLAEQGFGPDVLICPLYGALDPRAQELAIAPAPPGQRKIVLATTVAETSLTIEGVRVVIDSGLTRRPRFEPATGLTRLETVRVSQAAATQRAGRAGRLGPGVCYRLWDEAETRALVAYDKPEILDADLTGLMLDLAAWGVSAPSSLAFLDPPPAGAWAEARALLERLGALAPDGRLTTHGTALSTLPLPSRLAHMVITAGAVGEAGTAAALALLLTEPGLGGRDPDLRSRLEVFSTAANPRAKAARDLASRLARQFGGGRVDRERAGAWLAVAYPERVAKARGGGEYTLRNGRGGGLAATDPLARAPFLAVAELAGRAQRGQIVLAAPLAERDVLALFGSEVEERSGTALDPEARMFRARVQRRLGQIVLNEGPAARPTPDEVQTALAALLAEGGMAVFAAAEGLRQAQARLGLARKLDGDDAWPDWSDAALCADPSAWLAAAVGTETALDTIADRIGEALLQSLSYAQRQALDARFPLRFVTPAGGSAAINYTAENGPAVEVRLQELFGLKTHPSLAQGRVPLLLRLLSPAQRPVQTTKDLPGFWAGSYGAVRADLRGRYPKHPWPDDPASAEPTRKAKPRS